MVLETKEGFKKNKIPNDTKKNNILYHRLLYLIKILLVSNQNFIILHAKICKNYRCSMFF